ncbi:MAG: efflux RND transporter periplasmic adaptor subunit [Chlorobia bacterium]|nr:efflux RND transporter periplasmic adaptor subunit [Fimbriimonadaceae bacterium]
MATMIGCGKGSAKLDEHGHEEGPQKEEAGHVEGEAGHTEDIVLTAEAAKIAGIQVGEARRMPMQSQVKVTGTVTNTAQGRAVVTPPVAGKITRIHVKVGDNVRAGQPIATLSSADLAQASAGIIEAQRGVISAQAAVREARGETDIANAKLRTARQNLQRQKEFARTGAFSQPALQAVQRELNEAETTLESAQQEQVVHEAQLERAERLYKQELISRTELEQARLELQQDKTKQANAKRQIEIARAAYERERKIAERGLSNSKEIQTAEAEVRSANLEVQHAKIRHSTAVSGVAGAMKGVQAAQTAYAAQAGGSRSGGGTITVVAPISGIVTDREATLGQAVERITEICEIENLKTVWIIANVPEKQVGLVQRGSIAQITVSAFPNRIFSGVVQVLGGRLDPKSRTMPVQILVENSDGALRANMFTTVSLGAGAGSMALAVPRTAIAENGDKRMVYIAEEGGKYEERLVELGRTQGDYVEILSGLEAGAKIVVKGAFVLKSEKVKSELKGHEH